MARWGRLRFVSSPGRAAGDKHAPVRIIRPLDTEGWGGGTDSLESTTDRVAALRPFEGVLARASDLNDGTGFPRNSAWRPHNGAAKIGGYDELALEKGSDGGGVAANVVGEIDDFKRSTLIGGEGLTEGDEGHGRKGPPTAGRRQRRRGRRR